MKTIYAIYLFAGCCCLSSCGPVLYSSVGQNVPLFQKKGEVALTAGYGSTIDENMGYFREGASGFSGQIAAATGNSTVVTSSFYSLKEKGDDWNGKGTYFELGIGKFKYSEKSQFIGEIIVGTGFGSLKNSLSNEHVDLRYIKPFVQPSAGFSLRNVDFAFTPRIGFVSYTSKSENLTDATYKSAFEDFWAEKKNTWVFEPGLTIRAGLNTVKFQFQYVHTSFKHDSFEEGYNSVYDEYVSFGLFILISDRVGKELPKED